MSEQEKVSDERLEKALVTLAAELQRTRAELEQAKKKLAILFDLSTYSDSYGVEGSSFSVCRWCGGGSGLGGNPGFKHNDGCLFDDDALEKKVAEMWDKDTALECNQLTTQNEQLRASNEALVKALRILELSLDNRRGGGFHQARAFLRKLDIFDGDLNGEYLLQEVARAALARAEQFAQGGDNKPTRADWYCFACDACVSSDHIQQVFDRGGATGTCEQLAQGDDGWIPVSERPPEKDGTYLIYAQQHWGNGKRIIESMAFYRGWLSGPAKTVTHWRPLPAPPAEQLAGKEGR